MKRITLIILITFSTQLIFSQSSTLIEAESFSDLGGWKVDPQFVEQMGSPYLLAHGMGVPVADAKSQFTLDKSGKYYIWVRTMNWAPGEWEAPGRFTLSIDGKVLSEELGTCKEWDWQKAGVLKLSKGQHDLALHDLTGFEGRCDAIFLCKSDCKPPVDIAQLAEWRKDFMQLPASPTVQKDYDLVVTGGGLAGCAAAIAAAEQGLKVALIHDRPVLGGNASGEIRVHTLGIYGHFERILKMIDTEHYPNGSALAIGEDERRMINMLKYKNIEMFLNWRAYDASNEGGNISYVDARHTSTGDRIRFEGKYFVDATGDGWIGYWAGAEFLYGRENVNEYDEAWTKHGELWGPEVADNFVMGSSVLWGSKKGENKSDFPEVPWALDVVDDYAAANGEWQWEFSRNDLHQINDAEKIRDHMLKAIYGSFYNQKQKNGSDSLELEWVSYLVGKRESRRIVGDHVYTFKDVKENRRFPDSVVVETRAVDVHYQQNLLEPEKPDFLSEALFYKAGKYYVPYRSLYSKDVNNLFMAGRCFSSTHLGLGGPRVMRTTGQMGAAVGYAAAVAMKYGETPREVYENHLAEYMQMVLSSNEIDELGK